MVLCCMRRARDDWPWPLVRGHAVTALVRVCRESRYNTGIVDYELMRTFDVAKESSRPILVLAVLRRLSNTVTQSPRYHYCRESQ